MMRQLGAAIASVLSLAACDCLEPAAGDGGLDSGGSDAVADAVVAPDAGGPACAEGPPVIDLASVVPEDWFDPLVPVDIVLDGAGFVISYWSYGVDRCELTAEWRDDDGSLRGRATVEELEQPSRPCFPWPGFGVRRPWMVAGDATYLASGHSLSLYALGDISVREAGSGTTAPLAWTGASLVFPCGTFPGVGCNEVYILSGGAMTGAPVPLEWRACREGMASVGDAGRLILACGSGALAKTPPETLLINTFEVMPDSLVHEAGPFEIPTKDLPWPMDLHSGLDTLAILYTTAPPGEFETGDLFLALLSLQTGQSRIVPIASGVQLMSAHLASTDDGYAIAWSSTDANENTCSYVLTTDATASTLAEPWALGAGTIGGATVRDDVAAYLLTRPRNDGKARLVLGLLQLRQ